MRSLALMGEQLPVYSVEFCFFSFTSVLYSSAPQPPDMHFLLWRLRIVYVLVFWLNYFLPVSASSSPSLITPGWRVGLQPERRAGSLRFGKQASSSSREVSVVHVCSSSEGPWPGLGLPQSTRTLCLFVRPHSSFLLALK